MKCAIFYSQFLGKWTAGCKWKLLSITIHKATRDSGNLMTAPARHAVSVSRLWNKGRKGTKFMWNGDYGGNSSQLRNLFHSAFLSPGIFAIKYSDVIVRGSEIGSCLALAVYTVFTRAYRYRVHVRDTCRYAIPVRTGKQVLNEFDALLAAHRPRPTGTFQSFDGPRPCLLIFFKSLFSLQSD